MGSHGPIATLGSVTEEAQRAPKISEPVVCAPPPHGHKYLRRNYEHIHALLPHLHGSAPTWPTRDIFALAPVRYYHEGTGEERLLEGTTYEEELFLHHFPRPLFGRGHSEEFVTFHAVRNSHTALSAVLTPLSKDRGPPPCGKHGIRFKPPSPFSTVLYSAQCACTGHTKMRVYQSAVWYSAPD